jgi:hypothetical protein
MKRKFLNFAPSIGIGLVLLVITIVGLIGCEKPGAACRDVTSSDAACVACLNREGGCPVNSNGSWGYKFSYGVQCECN